MADSGVLAGADPLREGHRSGPLPVPVVRDQRWLAVVMLAVDVIAWTQHLLLHGELAKAEPKTLRYRLLHVAPRLTRGQRRLWLRIQRTWPLGAGVGCGLRPADRAARARRLTGT